MPGWGGAASVAAYLAASVSAGGLDYCAAFPPGGAAADGAAGICGGTTGITGFCASSPGSGGTAGGGSGVGGCLLPPAPAPAPLAVTITVPGGRCVTNATLGDAGAASLAAAVAVHLPGFSVAYDAVPSAPLRCSRGSTRSVVGAAYYLAPVLVSPRSRLDTTAAASFAAAALAAAPQAACSSTGQPPSSSPPAPAFCATLSTAAAATTAGTSAPPALCGTPGQAPPAPAVPPCAGAGASFAASFLSTGACGADAPPPASLASSLDSWWRFHLESLRDGKGLSVATVLPGAATNTVIKVRCCCCCYCSVLCCCCTHASVSLCHQHILTHLFSPRHLLQIRVLLQNVTYCLFNFRVVVSGPPSVSVEALGDAALNVMSSALSAAPVPCTSWASEAEFCTQQPRFTSATMCLAYPFDAAQQLLCDPRT